MDIGQAKNSRIYPENLWEKQASEKDKSQMDLIGRGEATASRAISKLVPLLTGEVKLPAGVKRSEIKALKDDLEVLRAFVRNAEAKSEEDEAVKEWLEQLKDATELIEDVADEYVLRASQHKKSTTFLRKAARLIGVLNNRRGQTGNLRNITALLREIRRRGQDYKFDVGSGSNLAVDWMNIRSGVEHCLIEDVVVGLEMPSEELVYRLTDREPRRMVIGVVGMGGIGKTTLARRVFGNSKVRRCFDCFAWISVSQSYDLDNILRTMARMVGLDHLELNKMVTPDLIGALRHFLSSKVRYLFVFDDVWDVHFFQRMESALPDENNGSRVLVTTRNLEIARFDYPYRLEVLSEEDSYILFCRKVFRSGFPDKELKGLCYKFVKECCGLPLAILALAGVLSRRAQTESEWLKVFGYLVSKQKTHLGMIHGVLGLSFHDLPYNLKLCFMYFGIVPGDSIIPNDKLVKLWIAEGFIDETDGQTVEQVAEKYLDELVSRNMVQECEGFYGIEKFSKVHDLVLEIARGMGERYSFCDFRDDYNSGSVGRRSRRLSISRLVEDNVLKTIEHPQVRCVFLSNIDALSNSFVVSLFTKYELLTLLDFENVLLEHLPEEVGNLYHLKYLSLKGTKVKRLPKSVGNLENLQTLDLRNTPLVELPIEINKLRKLRHLLATSYENEISLDLTQGVNVKEGIESLEELQTLMTVDANLSGIGLIKQLKKLKKLKKMGVSGLTTELSSALCASIEEMESLESLSLYTEEGEVLNLQSISSAPPFLTCLILKGLLHSFPRWISGLNNLSVLCLSLSKLHENPLENIPSLPSLMSLWLYGAYQGEHFLFRNGSFPGLKLLVLREMRQLKVVEIEEGALPLLEEIRIGPSPNLAEVPSGVRHLTNLQVISFYDMPDEFVGKVQPSGGSDYETVEHVRSVLFWYRIQGRETRDYTSYRLGESGLLERLQGSDQNVSKVFRRDLRLSFSYSDDSVDCFSRCSSSSDRCISEYDFDI